MVRPNRIKQTSFDEAPIGSLTSTAGGVIDFYFPTNINGFIQNVNWLAGNHTATGSLFITVSGTGETILTLTSGTTSNQVGADWTIYPKFAATLASTGIIISGANGYVEFTDIPMAGKVHVVGSGMGASKSGLGLNITYV